MNLADLIYIIPDFMNLFLPGFIFITLFRWLNAKNYDSTFITVWSLVISYVIKLFYSMIHGIWLRETDINEYVKLLTYILTGAAAAFLVTKLVNAKFVKEFLYKTHNKSVNDDIFDDIVDYEKPMMMSVYIKSSEIYYVGQFCFREEKGVDSWIALIRYCSVRKEDDQIVYNPQKAGRKSTVLINLKDVERIENFYEEDSKVYRNLAGE